MQVNIDDAGNIIEDDDSKQYLDALRTKKWLSSLQLSDDNKVVNLEAWNTWIKCIEESIAEPEGTKKYLELIKNDTNGS